ncbi:MAG: hypothetical protein PHS80_02545 [Methanothrix sp.]|nr:hypothetical protein [Methanothrix sp.]MDD4446425.1 hypothetical protein [Methanothrix sp.]
MKKSATELHPTHHPSSGYRRQALQKEAWELARDAHALQKAARAPVARQEADRLQGEAEAALAEAKALKLQAWQEDLIVWQRELVKQTRKGSRTYSYWMACWREGRWSRNITHSYLHLDLSQPHGNEQFCGCSRLNISIQSDGDRLIINFSGSNDIPMCTCDNKGFTG